MSAGVRVCVINPFIAPACKISGLNDTRTRLQTYIFRPCNTSIFSALRFDENPFKYQGKKEDKKA